MSLVLILSRIGFANVRDGGGSTTGRVVGMMAAGGEAYSLDDPARFTVGISRPQPPIM
jgi:hypothetical protein